MKFGTVLQGLRTGKKYARKGWNGKDTCIQLQVPDKNSKMTRPYIYLNFKRGIGMPTKVFDERIPWLASQSDILSDDWVVVK